MRYLGSPRCPARIEIDERWEREELRARFKEKDFCECMKAMLDAKKYAECMKVYMEFQKKYPGCDILETQLCWAIYHQFVENCDPRRNDPKILYCALNRIFETSPQGEDSPRWACARVLEKLFGIEQWRIKDRHKIILKYFYMIDPSKLSNDLTEADLAVPSWKPKLSPRGMWVMMITWGLYASGEYEKCMEECWNALTLLPEFHGGIDDWLKEKISSCEKTIQNRAVHADQDESLLTAQPAG